MADLWGCPWAGSTRAMAARVGIQAGSSSGKFQDAASIAGQSIMCAHRPLAPKLVHFPCRFPGFPTERSDSDSKPAMARDREIELRQRSSLQAQGDPEVLRNDLVDLGTGPSSRCQNRQWKPETNDAA